MSAITNPSLGAVLALVLALVAGLLAAVAAVWLHHADDDGDCWPGFSGEQGTAVADATTTALTTAVHPHGDHHV